MLLLNSYFSRFYYLGLHFKSLTVHFFSELVNILILSVLCKLGFIGFSAFFQVTKILGKSSTLFAHVICLFLLGFKVFSYIPVIWVIFFVVSNFSCICFRVCLISQIIAVLC